jgi:RNA polymerase sigma-70 factor (ECF subfamily)
MISPATSPHERLAQFDDRWLTCIDGIRARDSQALATLYDGTSSILYSFAMRVLGHPEDAEEVVLDVFKQVWKSIDSFDSARGNVLSWLVVLTRSRAIDRLRRVGHRRGREQSVEVIREAPSPISAPDSQAILSEERKMVCRAMERLAPEQRQAIEMAFFNGLTHAEVAEALNTPLGTIKTRIRMGMKRMQEMLSPRFRFGNKVA